MEFNEERAGMISSAIGLAVVNLVAFGVPINRDNLVDELERVRRETGNVIGKGLIEMLLRSLEKGYKKIRLSGRIMSIYGNAKQNTRTQTR